MGEAPYPTPLNAQVSKRMSGNRRRDTRPERAVRSRLHARGLRFRVDHRVQEAAVTVRPDVVFPRWRVAVFVDGCFWHGCPEHGNIPERNRQYWVPKLERNVTRDAFVTQALETAGWRVVRAWEHEPVNAIVANVVEGLADAGHPSCAID